eukprot:7272219-Prymnesium_polylepis.1
MLPLGIARSAASCPHRLPLGVARTRGDQGGHGVAEQRMHLPVGMRAVCVSMRARVCVPARALFPAAGAGSRGCDVDDAWPVNSIHLRRSQAVGESAPVAGRRAEQQTHIGAACESRLEAHDDHLGRGMRQPQTLLEVIRCDRVLGERVHARHPPDRLQKDVEAILHVPHPPVAQVARRIARDRRRTAATGHRVAENDDIQSARVRGKRTPRLAA